MIFDGMVKNVNNKVSKFLMYPRFLTKCLRMSQFVQISHTHQYVVPFHTKKLFTTLRVNSPSFSGRIVPLFDTMLIQQDEPASPVRDDSQGEACPTDSGFIADQDRATIAKSSTLPRDSAPRVTSPAAEEGSMQQTLNELTAFCTSLQRQHLELLAKFQAQEVEINRLKERVEILEDKEGVIGDKSGDDAPINGRSTNEGEAPAERISNDSEEIARVLTSMDAATVLAGETNVPIGSGFIPTAGPPATIVSTGSEVGPTASPIVRRRKGKEVMVEFGTPKKKKLQEQIDAQVARELEEQQEREGMRMNEQIARDAEVAAIFISKLNITPKRCFRHGSLNTIYGSENMGSLVRCFNPCSGPKLSDMGNENSGSYCQGMPERRCCNEIHHGMKVGIELSLFQNHNHVVIITKLKSRHSNYWVYEGI
nr:hypothetical protein [Tanacetum cinerariifolium]